MLDMDINISTQRLHSLLSYSSVYFPRWV